MKKNIVCFGDSNTHGYCAETGGRYDEAARWPKRLQILLGDDYLILEEGLSGRTTSFTDPVNEGLSGIEYIHPCLMSHEPVSLLIIMLGTNDTKSRFGASSSCIALGLKRLVRKAQAVVDCWAGGKPNILIITPKNIEKEYENTECCLTMGCGCSEKSEGLGTQYKNIANLTGCHYFDANTVVINNNKIDFMHLDEDGHRKLAEAVAKLVPGIV